MSVLVQFELTPPDPDKFIEASKKWKDTFSQDGAKNQRLYRLESEPSRFTSTAEWDGHDAMHESSEKWGDQFQADAGTEGVEWVTKVWTPVDI